MVWKLGHRRCTRKGAYILLDGRPRAALLRKASPLSIPRSSQGGTGSEPLAVDSDAAFHPQQTKAGKGLQRIFVRKIMEKEWGG